MRDDYFEGQGYHNGKLISLSPRQACEFLKKDALLVDLRDEYETNYRKFDVPQIVYVTVKDFKNEFSKLPKDKPLILADNAGLFSQELALFLIDNGYTYVASLIGGVLEWADDKMPLKIDRDFELGGQCSCKLKPRKAK
jgi:sulfur-carrier protein adenylyltransferase/sulfurtransferase